MAQALNHPSESPSTLGGRIQAARKRLGMTQALLGQTMGASQPQVAKWENGLKTPSNDLVVALAQVLQVPLRWLEAGGGPPPELGEAELEQLMQGRFERLQLILGGHADLKDLAEKSGLGEAALRLAQEGKRTLTLDEASRIAQAANFSLSWLLYGEKQTPFSLDLESMRKRPVGDSHKSKGRSERAKQHYKMDAILERRSRFVPLLWDREGEPSVADLSGIPQEVLEAYLDGRGDLTMDQIERILAANGASVDWVMHGEEPTFLGRVAAKLAAFSEAVKSISQRGPGQGFIDRYMELRGQQRLEWMLRYVRLRPVLDWVLTPEVYGPLTLSQCEAELAKRLAPKNLDPKTRKPRPLDQDTLEIAQFMLAHAGMNWFSTKRPSPELLSLAYQHALTRSLSGKAPDEAFIEELRRRIEAGMD